MKKNIDYSLYLCVESSLIKYSNLVKCIEESIVGGVTFIQIREKEMTTRKIIDTANQLKPLINKYGIPFVINDRVDIAIAVNADGVHLGQNDMPCELARKILGKDAIIGISVTTLEEAIKAEKDGADYIGVGAMYKSSTKKDAKIVSREELIKIKQTVKIPVVIIGGLDENTISNFKGLKIDGYAMITSIISNDNVLEKTKKILSIIKNN